MEDLSLTRKILLPSFPFVVLLDKHGKRAVLEKMKNAEGSSEDVNFGALLGAFVKAGLQHVDEKGLREALPAVFEDKPFCFARAVEPEHGEDGYVKCTFEENMAEKIWRDDDSVKVDFRERGEINNVRAGDLLAQLVLPTETRDGSNVLGQELKAKSGRQARLVAGKNVRYDPEERKAYAETDGCVKKVQNRISVDMVKEIRGNVDFRCGNIDFNGDVIVTGDVRESFSVVAEGSITVGGVVDRAMLKAGGDITVDSGLYGKEGVAVEADGNVSFAFAENAAIKAGGNVYVRNAMINCDVVAEGKVFLKAAGKALIGGHLVANLGVEANSLGNPKIPTKTVVEFGLRPELSQRLRVLQVEYPRAEEERREEIRQEVAEFQEEYEKQTRAKVIARHVTYPGVVFLSNRVSFDVNTEIARMVYYKLEDKSEISMRGIGPKKEK